MGGYFPLSHEFYDSMFEGLLDPFSKNEAILWLVRNANYADHTICVKGKNIEIKRGQVLGFSLRHLASKWNWGKSTVDRFLTDLKSGTVNGTRIETDNGTGILIITICNYDEITKVDKKPGTVNGTPSGTENGTVVGQYKYNKEDIKKEDITTVISPKESPPSINFLEIQWIWNEATGARVRDMTTVRQRKLRALLPKLQEHYGQDPPTSWRMYCEYIQASDVLGGRKSDWKAQLDWVLEPRNVTKILEGNYENRAITPLKPAETAYKRQSAFDAKIQGARSIIARRQQSGENKLGGI